MAKNSIKNILLLMSVMFALTTLAVSNVKGNYDLSWRTIDGGGGTSSGESFILTGTIAQYDAAYSKGGQYELFGGFWPGRSGCIVEFEDYARFAEYWLETGDDLPADLYKDEYNIVDYYDLEAFVYEWLYYCPYDWPLE
jgi:hypothetical protein